MNRFRMYGRTIELYRWRVDYVQDGKQVSEFCSTEVEADATVQRTGGIKTAIDTSNDEWIDGIEVADVPQPMEEAIRIYNQGHTSLIRQQRNKALAETDWTQVADAPFSEEEQAQIRAYRQSLRDIPQQEGFPSSYSIPELPSILSSKV